MSYANSKLRTEKIFTTYAWLKTNPHETKMADGSPYVCDCLFVENLLNYNFFV